MISLGIDIGTTTIRANVSDLNPQLVGACNQFTQLNSPLCIFTPYLENGDLDTDSIVQTLQSWATSQNLIKFNVGTILFTGEAQRATNWNDVSQRLKLHWPQLLSAQLNADTESRVAALGSGIIERSQSKLGTLFIHIDIGGGTSNCAKILNGKLIDTSCVEIGCRKWIIDPETGRVLKTKPFATALVPNAFPLPRQNEILTVATAEQIANILAESLIDHALQAEGKSNLLTPVLQWQSPRSPESSIEISLSGGIVETPLPTDRVPFPFGDLGALLRVAITDTLQRRAISFHFAKNGSHATSLGMAAHGFQISGSSIHAEKEVDWSGINIPVYAFADFKSVSRLPSILAVKLITPQSLALSHLKELAQDIISVLKLKGLPAEHKLIFLLEPNIAQTIGYLVSSEIGISTGIRLMFLDQIQFPARSSGIELIDIAPEPASGSQPGRYLLTVKSLVRF